MDEGEAEVKSEVETVNSEPRRTRGSRRAQLTCRPHMTRRASLIVVALVIAALVGVAAMSIPGSPIKKDVTLGLDLQGGLEVTLQAVPPKDRKLTGDGPRPLRLDHARPRRPARRRRARDPQAGQRPDHDPAPGRQGSRHGGEDHRQDGPARVLRPRGEPGAALDQHGHEDACRDRLRLQAPGRAAGARQERRVRPVLALQRQEEARRRPGHDEGGRAAQVQRQGAGGLQAPRGAARHRRRLVRPG